MVGAKILGVIGGSCLSGLLYWLGGRSWGNKAIRRFGCPLLFFILFFMLRGTQGLKFTLYSALQGAQGLKLTCILSYIITYILSALALSTYHDYLAPDKSSENWLCWLVTGFVYGLAAIPLLWCGVALWAIIGRAVFLAISIMWLRERTGKVFWEEVGSGFLYCVSMPLLLI